MPIRYRLSEKEIHRDWRRLRSIGGAGPGSTSPHTLLGIVHSDTATAAPVQGAMIVADSTPEWTELPHPLAAGYALVTDATDVAWDQTPTWTGDHTWDDGVTDSPALVLVGGSNDDTARVYLDDDAVAGNSDLVIRLVADDADAQLQIANNSGVVQAWIDATGDALFEDVTTDDHSITTGHGIIHADGVAAGQVLVADGVRYIPGDLSDILGGDAQFVVMALSATLANERVLTAGNSITVTDGGAGGAATVALATPGTLTVATANNAVAPHLHAITSSSNPGAAASILASDANGQLQLLRLGIGGASTASDNSVKFADDGWVGLAFNGGRFVFDSTPAPDLITVADGNLDLNGNDLIIDTDGDSYLHASADDVIDFVLAGASGELGITINGAEDFSFTANSFNVKSGSVINVNSILTIRSHGDVQATGADFYSDTQGGWGADTSLFMFIDADNSGTGDYFAICTDAETVAAATELMRVTDNPVMYLNRTIDNAYMSIGFTANQGTNDDEIMSYWSDDVAHGITDYANTKAFGQIHKNAGAYGGLRVRGLRADSTGTANWGAINLVGYLGETADTTKTTAGRGVVEITAAVKSGTGIAVVGADGNLVAIRNNATTRFILDAEGSGHSDVEWTTFAEHDDLALLDGLEASFGQFAEGHRRELEALGIAHFDDRPGHAMVNWTRLSMLLTGAVRQLAARVAATERALLEAGNASA